MEQKIGEMVTTRLDHPVDQFVEDLGMSNQIVVNRSEQDGFLILPGRFVALDVWQFHADQNGADDPVLELDRAIRAAVPQRGQSPVVLDLVIGLLGEFDLEHREVVRNSAQPRHKTRSGLLHKMPRNLEHRSTGLLHHSRASSRKK